MSVVERLGVAPTERRPRRIPVRSRTSLSAPSTSVRTRRARGSSASPAGVSATLPRTIVLVLGLFGVYAFVVSIQNANYYYDPYLSPFYSPCLTTGCVHPTFPIIGDWYNLSPAFLIVGSPLAFRVTCYYYRRSYYR